MLLTHATAGAHEETRRQIGTVGPGDSLKLRVDADSRKEGNVPQRLENFTLQLVREIDLTGGPVTKSKPEDVITDVANIYDCNQIVHVVYLLLRVAYSNGAIGCSGRPARASSQIGE